MRLNIDFIIPIKANADGLVFDFDISMGETTRHKREAERKRIKALKENREVRRKRLQRYNTRKRARMLR